MIELRTLVCQEYNPRGGPINRGPCRIRSLSEPVPHALRPRNSLTGCYTPVFLKERNNNEAGMLALLSEILPYKLSARFSPLAVEASEKFAGSNKKYFADLESFLQQCCLLLRSARLPPQRGRVQGTARMRM